MLNSLPLEITLHITTFLPFRDKINLILTCKKLYTLIFNNTLYQELHLESHGLRTLGVIFKKFKSKQLNGHQVKQLFIRSTEITSDNFRNLALIFPNVTELNDQLDSRSVRMQRPEDDLNSLLAWKDTLQRLHIPAGYSQLPTLIEKNVFPRLKYLSISPYDRYTLVRKSSIRLFRCLKNAPSLTHLRLYNITIHIKFLEKLHARFPQLESLTLGDLIIYTNKDAKITSVEPATRLLSLKLEMENIICDARCLFLDYIVAKYTNLKRLSFACLLDENWFNFEAYTHYVEERDDSDDDEEEADRNERMLISAERDHNLTQKAYSWEGSERFSRLPSTLEELKIDTCIFEDLAEALDSADIQPRKLDFLPDKSDSVFDSIQEIRFFQKWTSLTSLEITVPAYSHPDFGRLISDSVTRLKVYLPGDDAMDKIFINRILASFPAVRDLKIGNYVNGQTSVVTLCIDEYDNLSHAVYSNLRSLYVKCSLIDSKLPTFLANCTPNLKELTLDVMMNRTAWKYKKEHDPSMPVHSIFMHTVRLEKLNISVSNVEEEIYCRDDENMVYMSSKAYIEVASPTGSSVYVVMKDFVKEIMDLPSANNIKEDKIKNRVQIKLVHAGNIKEVTVGNPTI